MPLRGRERTNEGVPAGSYLISLLPKSDPADEVAAAAATTAMSREKGKHERMRRRGAPRTIAKVEGEERVFR